MNKRKEIIAKILMIPSIPTVAVDIVHMAQNPNIDIQELSKKIECDPGLTANFLRMANSSYFGSTRSITTVKNAVMRLGVNTIYKIIIMSSVSPMMWNTIGGYDLAPGKLLEHLLATAIGTNKLANILHLKVPDYAYTAALIHDIGKIVLGMFVAVDIDPIMACVYNEGISFEAAEKKILGIDHAEVGALLLESWKLPEVIVEAVRLHHKLDTISAQVSVPEIVHVSDILSLLGGWGCGCDGLNYAVSENAMAKLKLTEDQMDTLMYQVSTELLELRGLMVDST
ncbi:MAG TPA: histidine kinase [Candidatus Margulisbacteria bacterium]|nr:MAG: hypothetical protein A2X43_04610 [Candidatus Margulisbacteria bacterium GWD2_39_127]HAR61841.1 histidine kinase [Candidatus Margulisiibacteriota bacterium]HCT84212.1 histidine kinase [Candidatus Margulisiibacteriota bacterium]